jgi:hypothetical protein
MSDRLERDIEDVLDKIEDFEWHRKQRRQPSRARSINPASSTRKPTSMRWPALKRRKKEPRWSLVRCQTLLQARRARGLGLWLVLVGMILFLLGLAWNMRGPKNHNPDGNPRGGYWRDRYIQYNESRSGGVRDWFQRWRH